ncbi:MAG: hypothetical protein PHX65_05535, partial [Sulfurimonas sp.]|nr:hypothetical protein [Sulfurimonas sp.]
SSQITLKHNKHRIHPCPNAKKLSLLNLLIEQNNNLDTIVVTTQDSSTIKNGLKNENVKVLSDTELSKLPELKYELLISYDLPSDANLYISRVIRATECALILLDISEQKQLYPIETLLKRVIKQEIIAGFEYEEQENMKIAKPALKSKREYAFNPDADTKPKYEKKSSDKPRYDKPKSDDNKRKSFEKPKYDKPKSGAEGFERKPFEKPKRDGESSERKPFEKPKRDSKKPNKFLGKDENGKPKFSGKSGERNHRHDGKPKEGQQAPKNVGRKISIKERKPKNSDDANS